MALRRVLRRTELKPRRCPRHCSLSDDYTVIITADHGGIDYGHGGDTSEELTIPIFILGADFTAGAPRTGGSILDIAPTVADILGAAPNPSWVGKSLKD